MCFFIVAHPYVMQLGRLLTCLAWHRHEARRLQPADAPDEPDAPAMPETPLRSAGARRLAGSFRGTEGSDGAQGRRNEAEDSLASG